MLVLHHHLLLIPHACHNSGAHANILLRSDRRVKYDPLILGGGMGLQCQFQKSSALASAEVRDLCRRLLTRKCSKSSAPTVVLLGVAFTNRHSV
jgi:hypothetical protein